MVKKYFKLFIIIILLGTITFIAYLSFQGVDRIDELLKGANYLELSGKKPVFYTYVETEDSLTHVISYLDSAVLTNKNFNKDAAKKVISYVEKFAKERNLFKFNPNVRKGIDIEVKIELRRPNKSEKIENYVFIISDAKKIPKFLQDQREQYPLLDNSISQNKSFAWTTFNNSGSITIIYFLDDDSFKSGLPKVNSKTLSTKQRLNFIFNIEIWKRAAVINPISDKEKIPDHSILIYNLSESLWNTLGQLIVAKQENVPISTMQERLETQTLSEALNIRYYPYDEIAHRLYENAPSTPIISEKW